MVLKFSFISRPFLDFINLVFKLDSSFIFMLIEFEIFISRSFSDFNDLIFKIDLSFIFIELEFGIHYDLK